MKVIELKDVKKSYGKNEILHGISLDIEEGSIHGLVGRNGCCLLYTSDAADE